VILLAVLYFAAGFLCCAGLVYAVGNALFTKIFVDRYRTLVIETLEYTARTPTAIAKVAAELGDAHGIDDALRATARAMRKEGAKR
jgi:hypothetical protein